MQVAIVGGSGFIGTRLTKRLVEAGYQVKIIDKNPSHFYPDLVTIADVRDKSALIPAVKGSDFIINLAAEHKDNVTPRTLYDEVNVGGAANVCAAAEANSIDSIIFTSSVAVYGFAEPNTDESGDFNPFNDYGRTKMEAEKVYSAWQQKQPNTRCLTIIRPTVVFGERNRGNVYNLLKQIAVGTFLMIGSGKNKKSMAYVENVAAFIEFSLQEKAGIHVYNYVDKPDMNMNELVAAVYSQLDKKKNIKYRFPYWLGYLGGLGFDFLSFITRKEFPISSIRVKKFCATTQFASDKKHKKGFQTQVPLKEAIARTVKYEFIEERDPDEVLFYSE